MIEMLHTACLEDIFLKFLVLPFKLGIPPPFNSPMLQYYTVTLQPPWIIVKTMDLIHLYSLYTV